MMYVLELEDCLDELASKSHTSSCLYIPSTGVSAASTPGFLKMCVYMCMSVVYVCAVYEHMYVVAPNACLSVLISVYV